MFLGHLQVLFYTRPPNSQLLFSEPGNGPLLLAFDEPEGALGLCRVKKLHYTKSKFFWVTCKSCFMQEPKIPKFYFANLKTDPFSGF